MKILAVKFTNFWLNHLFVIQSELNDFLVGICFNPFCLTLLLDPALRIVTSKQARLVHDRGSPARLSLAGIRACRGSSFSYSVHIRYTLLSCCMISCFPYIDLYPDPALRSVTSKQARLVHDRGSPARLSLAGIRAFRGSGLHCSDREWVPS